MTDPFSSQLSAYLDHEIDPAAQSALEAHLAACEECRATLADLRAIVAAAPHYTGQNPSRDLWTGIAAGIGDTPVVSLASRRRQFGWRELIAASLVMAAAGGGAVWLAVQAPAPQAVAIAPDAPVAAPTGVRNAAFAEEQYDQAVRDLEQLLAVGRGRLDTATVRTIEQSLAKIDAALNEARSAVQRDPANAYLGRQIAANMRLKLNLLRTATNAIAAKS